MPLGPSLPSSSASSHPMTTAMLPNSPPTTPLRIAKRDGDPAPTAGSQSSGTAKQGPARRTSSSYSHLRRNNLVSKSPFKSMGTDAAAPAPPLPRGVPISPRKTSGEKRPRPLSARVETDVVSAKRRQSRGLDRLETLEPVSKSPFRQDPPAAAEVTPPLPPPPKTLLSQPPMAPPARAYTAPAQLLSPRSQSPDNTMPPPSRLPVMASPAGTPSRSALVSRRLHGPRIVGGGTPLSMRERRKTVTFDERCDVVEFDRESIEASFDTSAVEDAVDNDSDEEDYFGGHQERDDDTGADVPDDSYSDEEEVPRADDSIVGLMDSMLEDNRRPVEEDDEPHTPTRSVTQAGNTDSAGVPYGRTHHAERAAVAHAPSHSRMASITDATPLLPPPVRATTPPQQQPHVLATPGSAGPLGRSTHAERAREARVEEKVYDVGVTGLPPSPSPRKTGTLGDVGGLVPVFSLEVGARGASGPAPTDEDPFGSEPMLGAPDYEHADDRSLDLGNASVDMSMLEAELGMNTRADVNTGDLNEDEIRTSTPPPDPTPRKSLLDRMSSPFARSTSTSPLPPPHTSSTPPLVLPPSLGGLPSRIPIRHDHMPGTSNVSSLSSLASSNTLASEASSSHNHRPLPDLRKYADLAKQLTPDEIPQQTIQVYELHLPDQAKFNVSSLSLVSHESTAEDAHLAVLGTAERKQVGLGMRSALDRLVSDVASDASIQPPEDEDMEKNAYEEEEDSMDLDEYVSAAEEDVFGAVASQDSPAAPTPPPKDARRQREEAILQRRRTARRKEEDELMGRATPPRDHRPRNGSPLGRPPPMAHLRTKSEGGVAALDLEAMELGLVSGVGDAERSRLADSIARELKRKDPGKSKYFVREREEVVYATDEAHVTHSPRAGDIHGSKAWRPVRRPSDMHEYSKQIKDLRAQDKKAHAKVFVQVVGITNLEVPLPAEPTAVAMTLNNGIHFVTTPEFPLGKEVSLGQQFELIEHSKLEFTLALKVRNTDPHIVAQMRALQPPPPPRVMAPPPEPAPAPKSRGMRSFFKGSSSPTKKSQPSRSATPQPPLAPPSPAWHPPENLARYLREDGTLARAFVNFNDIKAKCDTCLLELALPLISQRVGPHGKPAEPVQVGEMLLNMFRLPPLPVPPESLPQSLEECQRGLDNVRWHKNTYMEGTLTQNGGDCASWRRRHLRLIGGSLVAFNDVTKKATASIDLRHALAVEDEEEARAAVAATMSPQSSTSASSAFVDVFDGPGVERSFRIIFPNSTEIHFYADTDEEKAQWLDVLRQIIGRVPQNPIWAELLWERHQEAKRDQHLQQQNEAA